MQPDPDTADPAEPTRPQLPGFRVGPFLGAGSSGQVWTVTRASDGARLAAKVLTERPEDVGLELTVLQRIEHDHVLRLIDTVLEDSGAHPRIALITELAEGGSLAAAVEGRGHFTVGELVTVLCPVARALHDLHALGLVHGDLSPANVLLTDEGKPLIADLGVARLAGVPDAQVWGSDGFVAPEVLGGALPTPAADVYALGALAWTALVGERPEPPALRPHLEDVAPQVPAEVRDLVVSCLSHTPEARPEPGDLALRLWDLARPAPAPLAGSSGRRTAPAAGDSASGLTQRIREAAEPAPEHLAVPWWRQRVVRRTAVLGGLVGVACAGYAALGPTATGAGSDPMAAPTSRPAAAKASATKARPSPSPSARRPSTRPTDDATGAETLGANPVSVLQRVVTARASAWTTGREADLGGAFVAGSSGWRRDQADLQQAARASVRYKGLGFRVRRAELDFSASDTVKVDAVVDRSAYALVSPAGEQRMPGSVGERATLTMEWTDRGWRISSWTPAASG
ncbi:serine/threonine protein kinase [Luteipulveratus mongoliensis]|uniref:serine/threonine protein kinase n=1 Tax=Luteipulveratus mongoliensis TaxID=571913 RepID=UPI000697DE7B|nr:serine/threonine-protein kinase [Luteipulveratus mongoliensis]